MTEHTIGTARGILRNSAALLLVGVFAKAMGLVIALLVARFLGPSAIGLFALLYGIAIIVEHLTTLGVPEILVREVAAKPERSTGLYRSAVKIVLVASVLPALAFLAASFWFDRGDPVRSSLLVLSLGTPIAGLFTISQAVLQGLERVLVITWVVFVTRVLSLAWLVFALWRGSDVEAAFVSRLLFLLGSIVVFLPMLWRRTASHETASGARDLLVRSVPFALNRIIMDLVARLPALVLPPVVGLARAGLFDAAERLRSTLGMTVSVTMLGMMPAFARNFSGSGSRSDMLIAYSAKYVAICISLVATGIAVFAAWIIQILYGKEFVDAVLPLQILAWAQVVVAVDSVLKQAMLAARHEYSAVRRALAGLVIQFVLIVAMARFLDLPGVSLGILISAVILLGIDLHFVVRRVARIQIFAFVAAPLLGAMMIGAVLILVDQDAILTRLVVAVFGWAVATAGLRLMPRDEARLLRQILFARRSGKAARGDTDASND